MFEDAMQAYEEMTPPQKKAAVIGGGAILAGLLAYFFWPKNAAATATLLNIPGLPGATTPPSTIPAQPVMIDVSGPVTSLTPNTSYVFCGLMPQGVTKSVLIQQLQALGFANTSDQTLPPTLFYYPGTAANSLTDQDPITSWPADLPWPNDPNFQQNYYAAAGTFVGTTQPSLSYMVIMQYVPAVAVSNAVQPVMYQNQPVWIASGGGLWVANFGVTGSPQKIIAVGSSQQEVALKTAAAIGSTGPNS